MFGLFKSKNQKNLDKLEKEVKIVEKYIVDFKNIPEGQKELAIEKDDKFLAHKMLAFSAIASEQALNMIPYHVQLLGAFSIMRGNISEMKTGEGKTLVIGLAALANAMMGRQVHAVTVNDYLAQRDYNLMKPMFDFYEIESGYIQEDFDINQRAEAYSKSIIYGANSQFGFDYLRSNVAKRPEEVTLRNFDVVIIDEVDSILIDESRTPLIISDQSTSDSSIHIKAEQFFKEKLGKDDYEIDREIKQVIVKDSLYAKAEEYFNVENLYEIENVHLAYMIEQAIYANEIMENDKQYTIRDGVLMIIDEYTGRISEGRTFSGGLHQAIEAKEGIELTSDTQSIAETTYQNFFRKYKLLSGMSGTVQTEATEFFNTYNVDVISIPTNKPLARIDNPDKIFINREIKYRHILNKVLELNAKGQPVLVGTNHVETSEELSNFFTNAKIKHEVLNAKNHFKEAEVIANAGDKGAVTIATNMAGRGVDIKLSQEILDLGGLYILGTERHDNRRIDNQLRGRSGRQGEPGESSFYISLEDALIKDMGGSKIQSIMKTLHVDEDTAIDSPMLSKSIEKLQKKVEEFHYEARKNVLEYDDVINIQRQRIYKFRNAFLFNEYNYFNKLEEYSEIFINNVLKKNNIFPHFQKEDINEQILKNIVLNYLHINIDFEKEIENYEECQNMLHNAMSYRLEQIISIFKDENSSYSVEMLFDIQREIVLNNIDNIWREHLKMLHELKTGVSLRQNVQKDPMSEFKKDSYHMFENMIERIKMNIVIHFYSISIQNQNSELNKENNLEDKAS